MSGCGDMDGTISQEIHTWLLLYRYQILFVCKLYLELKGKKAGKANAEALSTTIITIIDQCFNTRHVIQKYSWLLDYNSGSCHMYFLLRIRVDKVTITTFFTQSEDIWLYKIQKYLNKRAIF